jgi:acyl-CoA thioester hydrolase
MKFIRPLRYGQKFKVQCSLLEYQGRIRITYVLSDAATGDRLHKAETVQLAVTSDTGELLFDCPPELSAAMAKVGG